MKGYVRCTVCSKIIGEIDEVTFTQFGDPMKKCEECEAKDINLDDAFKDLVQDELTEW